MSATSSSAESVARTRVLCYIGSLQAGGAERQVVELLRHLDRTRFQPMLLLAHHRGELLADVPADVPVWEATLAGGMWFPGSTRWRRILRFTHILREQQIDIVYDRTYLATLDAACACWLTGTPRISAAVADPRVQFELYARRPRWLWRRLSRWAYHSANRVLANSAGLREQLIEFWRLPAEKVLVQPNACDFERMQLLADAEPAPPPAGRVTLLTVGRIDEDKGHRDLLAALAVLVKERGHPELVWRIVGAGPDRGLLEQEAARLGLARHVVFTGVLANPFPEYRKADLFCLPSRSEGLPNVLIEALACGTPVLSTDCPSGPREILHNGTLGELVPVRDPAGLADRIEDFLQDPSRWRQRAVAARSVILERYSAAMVIRRLEALLDQEAGMKGDKGV